MVISFSSRRIRSFSKSPAFCSCSQRLTRLGTSPPFQFTMASPALKPAWAAELSESTLLTTKDRKSTRLNSSHGYISYAVFCLKKKKTRQQVDLRYLDRRNQPRLHLPLLRLNPEQLPLPRTQDPRSNSDSASRRAARRHLRHY